MMRRPVQPRHQRFTVLAAVFVLHAVLIAFLLLQSTTKLQDVEPARTVALIAIDAERPAAAKPPPPALPAKVADTFVPVTELSIPADSESNSPAGASAVCATLGVVIETLLLDAIAVDAIRNAPPETRSVADAIVIWNVGWAPTALTHLDPLFVVRTAIERSLSGVADNCLDEAVAGPRLIPIPDASGSRTIFVVLGSGNWTWRALLSPPPLPGAEGVGPVPNLAPTAAQ